MKCLARLHPHGRIARLMLSIMASLFMIGAVQAQTYPDRPVRLIVPYPPGGITDTFARTIAQRVSSQWGQQMFVENKAGASGNIGLAAAAKAPADGYTIVFGNTSTHAINVTLFKDLPFDPIKDFEPVTMVARVSNVLLVKPDFPATSLKELIALAKSKPGELTFASNSTGSSNHLAGELLKTMAGIDMLHVPYKSTTGALVDLFGGRISLMFADLTTSMPYLRDGRVRALAVTSSKRVPQLPDVPTMTESGLDGFVVTPWWGIFAPAGTPKALIARLNHEIATALRSKEVSEYFAAQATDVVGDSPEEFRKFVGGEAERWGKVVRSSGAKLD